MKHSVKKLFAISVFLAINFSCYGRDGNGAIHDLERAAYLGDKQAAMRMVDYYLFGSGNNEKKALFWIKKYSEISGESPLLLAQLLLNSDDSADVGQGVLLSKKLCRDGDPVAAIGLAKYFKDSEEQSAYWYRRAALLGDSLGIRKYADQISKDNDRISKIEYAAWKLVLYSMYPENGAASLIEKKKVEESIFLSPNPDVFSSQISMMANVYCENIESCRSSSIKFFFEK